MLQHHGSCGHERFTDRLSQRNGTLLADIFEGCPGGKCSIPVSCCVALASETEDYGSGRLKLAASQLLFIKANKLGTQVCPRGHSRLPCTRTQGVHQLSSMTTVCRWGLSYSDHPAGYMSELLLAGLFVLPLCP